MTEPLSQISIGEHLDAITLDLAARPALLRIVGDARPVLNGSVICAEINRTPADDSFWFFEATDPFTSREVFGPACALVLSLAYITASTSSTPGRATAIVLRGEDRDLYFITTNTPAPSPDGGPMWTSYILPFDASLPWRVAGETTTIDGVERVATRPGTDRLATLEEIHSTLGSLRSLRIRGGQPAASEMVLIRQLSVIRVDSHIADREPINV